MTLDQLDVDRPAVVVEVVSDEPVMLRLMEMGLVPGAPVSVRKRAPWGGPLELRVRDYVLSMRRAQARLIKVKLA